MAVPSSPPPAPQTGRPSRRRPAHASAALAAGVLLLVGCSGATPSSEPAPAPAPTAEEAAPAFGGYVAIGDSYTAAPFVPQTDVASGCFRSDSNYPSLVAESLGADLDDVSCSGAETADLTDSQVEGVAPQADALSPETELVTVGLGGNDGGVFDTLVSRCRAIAPPPGDTEPTGATCPGALGPGDREVLLDTLRETRRQLAATLEEVRSLAPSARVVAIGYPQIVAADRRCDVLPLGEQDQAHAAELNQVLNDTVRGAARLAGAEFVDAYAATRGHDICAEEPWVNGIVTDQRRALAFHPFAEEQQAVADAVVDLVTG